MADGADALAQRLAALGRQSDGLVVGLTGSVASGKTTLAAELAERVPEGLSAQTVSTDGFLYPNAVLEERELLMRKGFPDTYDRKAMAAALVAVREGAADFPAHSHETYDIDPALTRTIEKPDLLILEGLGFSPPTGPQRKPGEPDVLIYLDADLALVERWFLERFMRFWQAAEHDPTSFYAQFRHMSAPEVTEFAMSVWTGINLPNLENHILPLRAHADIVLKKAEDHSVRIAEDRLG